MTQDNPVNAKWPEIRKDIKKTWGKLNDAELEKTHGDIKKISAMLQGQYGETVDVYDKKLTNMFQSFDGPKDQNKTAVTEHSKDAFAAKPSESAKASAEPVKAPVKN